MSYITFTPKNIFFSSKMTISPFGGPQPLRSPLATPGAPRVEFFHCLQLLPIGQVGFQEKTRWVKILPEKKSVWLCHTLLSTYITLMLVWILIPKVNKILIYGLIPNSEPCSHLNFEDTKNLIWWTLSWFQNNAVNFNEICT